MRFRTTKPIEVSALTTWAAPFTGGDIRSLPAGEEFVVLNAPPEGASAVTCRPVRYEELHQHFVRYVDRSAPTYESYYLVVSLEQLRTCCTSLSE
jgi:hypothetical protein